MNILTIITNKGGSGKNTAAVSIGSVLSRTFGKKVLLVDLDPQANLTEWFGTTIGPAQQSIYNALLGQCPLPRFAAGDNLHYVPADIRLSKIEEELKSNKHRSQLLSKDLLAKVSSEYDYCIIDTPPHLGSGCTSALLASDYAIIPMVPEAFSLSGAKRTIDFVNVLQRHNRRLETLGLLIQRVKRTRLHRDIIEQAKTEFGDLVFETVIRESIEIANASNAQWDIIDYSPNCRTAHEYISLTETILHRIQQYDKGKENG